jgi:Alpha-L-rhamnosidase N-terminal domain./F5/8 type C domain./Bacterial alpha-L-rhamnosidase.
MKKIKKMLSLLLTLPFILPFGGQFKFTASAMGGTAIVSLKTEDAVNPVGIDNPLPRFSWQMESDVIGQKQTAYQIIVSKDESFSDSVWDSGKVTSDFSNAIEYAGTSLEPSTTYFWKVTVWDKSNIPYESDVNTFEMGLLSNAEWTPSKWISGAQKAVTAVPDNFKYVVEGDFTSQSGGIGLVFNYVDITSCYMWQLNTDSVIKGKVLLRPHSRQHSSWNPHSENYTKDITSLVGGVNGFSETPAHLKVEVTKTHFKTYINDMLISTLTTAQLGGVGPFLGKIGVRTSGENEKGTVDNLKLTDYTNDPNGVVVYNYDFEGYNPLGAGTLDNGALSVSNTEVIVQSDTPTVVRKEFAPNSGKTIKSATLYSSGLGAYDVFINGERVGTKQSDGSYVYDELKPGFTQIGVWEDPNWQGTNQRVHYYTYDVKDLLKSENNAISALITSGYWMGAVGGAVGKATAFRAQLLIRYTDGTEEVVATDTSWKSMNNSHIQMADIFAGEYCDSTISDAWKNAGYNDSDWAGAVINTEFNGQISSAIEGSKIKIRKDLELNPKTTTVYNGYSGETSAQYGKIDITGTYSGGETFDILPGEKAIVDLGQNFSGWPEMTISGAKDVVVIVRHGEMLNDNDGIKTRGNDGPEGSLYRNNLHGAEATSYYRMNSSTPETYRPTYTSFGFRYAEISATEKITVSSVKGIVITSVAEESGKLSTSNAMVNQLISNIKWGQYSNYMSIPTDCPQRAERLGWTADTHIFSTTAAYLADSKGFLSKWMTDMRDAQIPNGNFPEVAPKGMFRNPGAAGWSDAGVIVPYNLYKMYGDASIIEDNYNTMVKFMDYMASRGKGGGVPYWGDWLGYEINDDMTREMIAVAYYALDAQLMAKMAAVIGKTSDVTKYNNIYQQEKTYFQGQYVNADGTLKRENQIFAIMALKMNLLPNETSRQKAIKALKDNIKSKGNKLQTGFIGTASIMQTLSEIGLNDVAYDILLQREEPSWLFGVDQGATTVWEHWGEYSKENGFDSRRGSFNHYSFGVVAEWMYESMAGIMYDETNPGFKKFVLQPSPDQNIKSVDCEYNSAYGKIKSSWKYEDSKFIYNATVPANTSAKVYLPIESGKAITVNGKSTSALSLAVDGIEYVKTQNGKAEFNAASGTFKFETGITQYNYVNLTNLTENTDYLVKIDGGNWQQFPGRIKAAKGQAMSFEVKPVNTIEYSFNSFDGDVSSASNQIAFNADDNMEITVSFNKLNFDNLTAEAMVTSNRTIADSSAWAPINLVDGITIPTSASMGYSSDELGSTTPAVKPWIHIDLRKTKDINRFHFYPRTDTYTIDGKTCNFPVDFIIEARNSTTAPWTTAATYTGEAPLNMPLVVSFDNTISARYVRITVNKVSPNPVDEGRNRLQLTEIGIYNYPTPTTKYTVSVNGGNGSGSYLKDDTVTVTADTPAQGYRFKSWTVNRGGITIGTNANESFIMPANNVEITANYEKAPLVGDIDGDGDITVNDAHLTLQIAIGNITPDSRQKEAADVFGNGVITASNALRILQFAVGMIKSF